jgi:hypothetical protein
MRMRQLALGLIAMTVAACAPTLPPNPVAVSDFRSLAGTYTGTMNEASELNRSVRLRLEPDGSFELAVGDPKGFRTTGQMALVSDGIRPALAGPASRATRHLWYVRTHP